MRVIKFHAELKKQSCTSNSCILHHVRVTAIQFRVSSQLALQPSFQIVYIFNLDLFVLICGPTQKGRAERAEPQRKVYRSIPLVYSLVVGCFFL